MATEEQVVSVLRYMAAAWPRSEVTPETVAVYVIHMLRTGLAADVLLLAAMRLVDTLSFLPSVAEWRQEAERVERERGYWAITANHRLWGHPLPSELQLPAGLGYHVLGYEPDAPQALPAGEPPARPARPNECRRWEEVLERLEMQLARSSFDAWLRGSWAEEGGDALAVHIRNGMAVEWLAGRFGDLIGRAVWEVFGRPMSVRFVPPGCKPGHLEFLELEVGHECE